MVQNEPVCTDKERRRMNRSMQYLQKERERYHKRKEKGEIKLIHDMSEREKRLARKNWRVRKQRERRNQNIPETFDTPPPTPSGSGPFPIRMNNAGRKRVRKDRAKAYRELEELKVKLAKQKRLTEKYKKRLHRRTQKTKDVNSPRTKTRIELKGQKVNKNTRRTLLFHYVLLKGIREKYQNAKSDKTKQAIHNDLLRKYRMKMMMRRQLK